MQQERETAGRAFRRHSSRQLAGHSSGTVAPHSRLKNPHTDNRKPNRKIGPRRYLIVTGKPGTARVRYWLATPGSTVMLDWLNNSPLTQTSSVYSPSWNPSGGA